MPKTNFFVNWHKEHGRVFPWRREGTSSFAFLVTEMLLRQTRASGVAKLWDGFIEEYPDAEAMMLANQARLANRLKVLGFGEQKAEALKSATKWIVKYHEGQVPHTLEELLKIPHIGHYAARAILCFAFGQRVEILDTNILRFFARYFGIEVKPDIRRNPKAWDIAKQILPRGRKQAQRHNYGILDFTAEVCKPGRPRCEICPLSSSCVWGSIQLRNNKENLDTLKWQ